MEHLQKIESTFLAALRRIHAYPRFSILSCEPDFLALHQSLGEAPSLLAHIYEAVGTFDLLLVVQQPTEQLTFLLHTLGSLIKAAFFHQRAGQPTQASAVAQRAMIELRSLTTEHGLQTDRKHNKRLTPPYVWEMLGDAAVCVDHDEARRAYAQAAVLFSALTEIDEASEGCELFPGDYLFFMAHHFLTPTSDALHANHSVRLHEKRRQWLGE